MKILFSLLAATLLILSNALAFVYYAPMTDHPPTQQNYDQQQNQGPNQGGPYPDQNRTSYYYSSPADQSGQQQNPPNQNGYGNNPYYEGGYSRQEGDSETNHTSP